MTCGLERGPAYDTQQPQLLWSTKSEGLTCCTKIVFPRVSASASLDVGVKLPRTERWRHEQVCENESHKALGTLS